ncbi:MAG: uroporphyrinogen-III synthase [Burkholderiales bacterium]
MGEKLDGFAILIIRPAGLGDALADMIRAKGGEAILFPAIEILPPPRPQRLAMVIARLHTFDWAIFVSPTAAREGMSKVRERRRWPVGVRMAAVGRGTADALLALGASDVLAPEAPGDSEALAALPDLQEIVGQNVVIFRGDGGREYLGRLLAERGARVEYAECYRRARPAADAAALLTRWRSGAVHAVCAASSEALSNLLAICREADAELLFDTPVFVPHPRVAEAAQTLGFRQIMVTIGGDSAIVEGLATFFAKV